MRYLSVCSGIEAASVAWHPLGWTPIGFSEIEPFPSAVLSHHYPKVKNYGDMSKFRDWSIRAGDIDLLVGGTPCQSFSIAGLRQGLKDPRGNLMLTFLAIAEHLKPKWIVWENVPGVLSSNGGKDFGSFLGGLGELGYGFAYRVLDAQWCRTHRHPRAVPQRRRRVFVVGCLGDHISPAKVLFESESMLRYSAKSKATGKGIAEDVAGCLRSGGDGGVPSSRGEHLTFSAPISSTLNASFADKQGLEDQHALNGAPCFVIDVPIYCGSNVPLVIPIQDSRVIEKNQNGIGVGNETSPAYTIDQTGAQAVAYSFDSLASNSMKSSNPVSGCNVVDVAKCIDTSIPCPSKNQGGIAIAMVNMQGSKSNACVTDDGSSYTINAMHGHDVHAVVVAPTQNAFDVGDVRATTAILSTMPVDSASPTLTAKMQGSTGWAPYNKTAHLVPVLFENHPNDSRVTGPHDVAPSCVSRYGTGGGNVPLVIPSVAIQGTVIGRQDHNGLQGSGCSDSGEMFTLTSTDVHAVAVAPTITATNDPSRSPQSSEITQQVAAVHASTMQVRRLTPTECERLQGFPDGWTAIPWKKKPADQCPDGPRYKALGNSMAVNCMEWLGERIQKFDQSSLCQLP